MGNLPELQEEAQRQLAALKRLAREAAEPQPLLLQNVQSLEETLRSLLAAAQEPSQESSQVQASGEAKPRGPELLLLDGFPTPVW